MLKDIKQFLTNPLHSILVTIALAVVLILWLTFVTPFYDNADDQSRTIMWSVFLGVGTTGIAFGLYSIALLFTFELRHNPILTFDDLTYLPDVDMSDVMTFKEYWEKKHGKTL